MLPCGKLQRRVNLKQYGINVEEMLAQRELEQN